MLPSNRMLIIENVDIKAEAKALVNNLLAILELK